MEFSKLVEIFQRLEKITARLEMTSIISKFLEETPGDLLPIVILLLQGKVFPEWSNRELGIGSKLLIRALADVSGKSVDEIEDKLREKGDIGLVAEECLQKKSQVTLFIQVLTVEKVHFNLDRISQLEGERSQEKKLRYLSELLLLASPLEAKYISRLVLEELRLGVGKGIVRDAIAQAFRVDASLVDRAYYLTSDLGEVAKIAKLEGEEGLKKIELKPGRPIQVMLAQRAENLGEVIEKFGKAAFEIKYDGARLQVHKYNGTIELYTRRLENVTKQFPEVVEWAKNYLKAENAIVEGELVAILSCEDRRPRPFQELSKRIKRKYDIDKIKEKIPVELNLFDIIYLNGKSLLEEKFIERRKTLESIIIQSDDFKLAKQLITSDLSEAEKFYKEAIDLGHEGVMAKNLNAPYQPGSRVGYMYKIKPIMETLDLVIVGATWGEGRRAHLLGSYLLGILDESTGELLTIGRMATGFTDEQLEEMTKLLKPDIIYEKGKEVVLKPRVVVEVGYEEIQKSPKYTSGYALRFPRLIRIRYDKSVEEADTLSRLEKILELQEKK
ncbi:MAG TPA: ATP-dependent DNA ligase [Candidatus Altiarchaeales archaeon]|nr:ATP-dependent DNA ligase [Candidatus Altiarchaeales archaeon]